MEETMMNSTTEELNEEIIAEEEVVEENKEDSEDLLKKAINEQMRKIQRQNLLIGCQVICKTILDKITSAMSQPGKRTMNDYKRLIKDVENFCRTGLSRQINENGEVELSSTDAKEGV